MCHKETRSTGTKGDKKDVARRRHVCLARRHDQPEGRYLRDDFYWTLEFMQTIPVLYVTIC